MTILTKSESREEALSARLVGSIVCTGALAFLGILTETVMTVLFPELMIEFHVDMATVQWITTIYLLAVAVTMPLASYLQRRFMLRHIFAAATLLSLIGATMMIVVHHFELLLIARVLQGIGSGIATPLMINIILQQAPRRMIGRLMGVGSLVITVAPAIGPTVGASVTSIWPWRAIYVATIPVMLLAFVVGWCCIDQHQQVSRIRLDVVQLVLIVLALAGAVIALNQAGIAVNNLVTGQSVVMSASWCIATALIFFGCLAWFVHRSQRSSAPLLRLQWLKDAVVYRHAIAYCLMPMVGIGFGYVVTNVAQLALGTSSVIAGQLVLPGALGGAVLAPVGGWLFDTFGARKPILATFGVACLGPLLLLICSMHLNAMQLMLFYAIFGLSYALGNANVMTSALRQVEAQWRTDANAVFNTLLQFGGALGTTLFSTLISVAQGMYTARGVSLQQASVMGALWCFAAMLAICLVSWILLYWAFQRASGEQS